MIRISNLADTSFRGKPFPSCQKPSKLQKVDFSTLSTKGWISHSDEMAQEPLKDSPPTEEQLGIIPTTSCLPNHLTVKQYLADHGLQYNLKSTVKWEPGPG